MFSRIKVSCIRLFLLNSLLSKGISVCIFFSWYRFAFWIRLTYLLVTLVIFSLSIRTFFGWSDFTLRESVFFDEDNLDLSLLRIVVRGLDLDVFALSDGII